MLKSFYEWVHVRSTALPLVHEHKRIIKYVISGATAAATDLLSLYALTDLLGVHYLVSSVVAFLVAFGVSFFLQKFWTFRDNRTHLLRSQMFQYGVVAFVNLTLNSLFLYLFVERFHVWYVFAQIAASVLVAFFSFFIYRNFIFSAERAD